MDIIRAIEQQQIKQDVPEFNVGDNVKVHYARRGQPQYPGVPEAMSVARSWS